MHISDGRPIDTAYIVQWMLDEQNYTYQNSNPTLLPPGMRCNSVLQMQQIEIVIHEKTRKTKYQPSYVLMNLGDNLQILNLREKKVGKKRLSVCILVAESISYTPFARIIATYFNFDSISW